MPRVISIEDGETITLAECVDGLSATGFDPCNEDSLANAALLLRRLGNNRNFLGDLIVEELAQSHREEIDGNSYGPQVIMLSPPGNGDFFMRANIWPSQDEHMVRASGGASFVYSMPHDHNFSFLTLGYFGPGYWSDYYEIDYERVAGWTGEPVDLRFMERSRLDEGKIQLYRAHIDVHAQDMAEALSVSINIMHTNGAQGWLDQYRLDIENRRVAAILNPGASEAFLRVAVGMGSPEARDLAESFARSHPSDRMRLHAFDALASVAPDQAARDEVWRFAEIGSSRLVRAEALQRRAALAVTA